VAGDERNGGSLPDRSYDSWHVRAISAPSCMYFSGSDVSAAPSANIPPATKDRQSSKMADSFSSKADETGENMRMRDGVTRLGLRYAVLAPSSTARVCTRHADWAAISAAMHLSNTNTKVPVQVKQAKPMSSLPSPTGANIEQQIQPAISTIHLPSCWDSISVLNS